MPAENYIIERIEYFCKKKALTRYRLAQKSGIAQSSLSTLLNRKSVPSIPTLEKICNGLDITLAQFFAGDDIPDLTDQEKELIAAWSNLNENQRALVMAYIQGLSQK